MTVPCAATIAAVAWLLLLLLMAVLLHNRRLLLRPVRGKLWATSTKSSGSRYN
jgi:hypothetical protein